VNHNPDPQVLLQFDSAEIDYALASSAWVTPIPDELKTYYRVDLDADRRRLNRWVIASLTLIFDLFWLVQLRSAPELVPMSGLLRFGFMTPCAALFILLDWKDWLGRWYETMLWLLALQPAAISAALGMMTTSPATMSDIRTMPLILLATGTMLCMTLPAMIANALISASMFVAAMTAGTVVPRTELDSMILTDLAIAAAVIAFKLQLERRDRRVFLLNMAERIRRADTPAHTRGRKASQTDAVTGVANRRRFDETLASEWHACRQSGKSLGLILFGVENFQKFIDHYGLQGGDECLRRVATEAACQLRDCDLLARYGNREFAVILPGADAATATKVAERMRSAIKAIGMPHFGISPSGHVRITVGAAAVAPTEANVPRQLIEMADAALHDAIRSGRNQIGAASDDIPQARITESPPRPRSGEHMTPRPVIQPQPGWR
jgi:diguanylate cyclase (GGDEF)-like protein